jgi:hypothetical protein
MSGWLKRFGFHLAAAIGATGVFVAAAAVGASQNHPAQVQPATTLTAPARSRTPAVGPRRTAGATPTPGAAAPAPASTPEAVLPERSLAGTVQDVEPDTLVVLGVGGHTWRVQPAPGALIRLNGKAARLDALAPGDSVVILGQAQRGPGARFLAHAITARRK